MDERFSDLRLYAHREEAKEWAFLGCPSGNAKAHRHFTIYLKCGAPYVRCPQCLEHPTTVSADGIACKTCISLANSKDFEIHLATDVP